MRKLVVISSTDNNDYLFYLPIVSWAWAKLGWGVMVLITSFDNDKIKFVLSKCGEAIPYNDYCYGHVENIIGYREETLAQCSRLYAADYVPNNDTMMLTSDSDMLPLSDYWKPNYEDITCYGRNLSDKHQPICYISANSGNWDKLMSLTGGMYNDMMRDLDTLISAKSDEWNEWWQVDQDLVTERLSNQKFTRIDRGINPETGYPIGRVDRSAWDKSLLQKERIDAHLFRAGYLEENWVRIMSLIKECFNPTQDEIFWLENYRAKYLKLM